MSDRAKFAFVVVIAAMYLYCMLLRFYTDTSWTPYVYATIFCATMVFLVRRLRWMRKARARRATARTGATAGRRSSVALSAYGRTAASHLGAMTATRGTFRRRER
jgi:uncharacterized membrane protein